MSLEKAERLCRYYTETHDPKMKWMWGEGLFGYALAQLDEYLEKETFREFLEKYCDIWYDIKPAVHSSDTSAPGLITYSLQKKYKNKKAAELTKNVLAYMKNEPRILETLVNHMGHSGYDIWYPKSVWVDSLMMFGVFAGLYGRLEGDDDFLNMAKQQPVLLAKYLQDKKTGLWYHSYWTKLKTHYPVAGVFWGRGNSWVISAIPKILDSIGECEQALQMKKILFTTSQALLKRQHRDGSFSTILGPFGVYKESSATALIADGWMHAVRRGYLPESFLEPALKAYEWVDLCVKEENGKVLMTKISGPTIPLPALPWLGYALVPRKTNWSYGMAGYVWASIEYDKIKRGVKTE